MPKASQCVNPIYLKCLEEWRDEIKAKNPGNKMANVVGKAVTSLKTHPHVIYTPRDCRPLPYFGEWIIKNLTERLGKAEGTGNARPSLDHSQKRASLDASSPIEVSAAAARAPKDQSKKTTKRHKKAPALDGNLPNSIVVIPHASPRQSSGAVHTLGWDPYVVVGEVPSARTTSLPSTSRTFNRSNPSVAPFRQLPRCHAAPAGPTRQFTTIPSATVPSAAPPNIGRTSSAPIITTGHEVDNPVLLRVSGRAPNRPRPSSHIPPPTAIDQQLERFLDSEAGTHAADINNMESSALFELPFTPIVYPAGSYDIVFILDSREVKSTKHREYIQAALIRGSIPVERRALEVGDMCWVARHRETKDEIVLDFIIERKRLDDLVTSIKDGRFHEQKFRLKQSGISKIYYLVEEYTADCVHHSMDKAVFTALSSTQIIDGFFLKETRDIDDTIEYLVGLHHTIVAQYRGQALRVIPENAIKRHSHIALITQLRNTYPDMTYHTTYTAFRELNKSGAFTLKEVFAYMLLCIRGMSPEKVANVLEHYDTPRKLWEAFRKAEQVEARERELELMQLENENKRGRRKKSQVIPAKHMLTRLAANGRRQIKGALAEQIYDLFMSEEY